MATAGPAGAGGVDAVTEPDRGVVEHTLRISAKPETVWRYWTDPERMCAWWGQSAELDPRPGGVCLVDLGGGPVMRGEFVELVPHELIVFSFGWDPTEGAPAIPAGSTLVEVTLTADGDDTILALRHSGIPAAHVEDHVSGWRHFLTVLGAVAGREGLAAPMREAP
jgi:uncharacterized protein YndB with AHSA1/START domain